MQACILREPQKILKELILSPDDEVDVTKLAKCVRCQVCIFHFWSCDTAQINSQVQLSLIRDPNITAELIGEVVDWARDYRVLLSPRDSHLKPNNFQGTGKYPEEELHWLTVTASSKPYQTLQILFLTAGTRHGTRLLNSRGS